jgi:hypothetical protein
MRGFPLLRLVFLAVTLGLLAIPVWSLTRAKTEGGDALRLGAAEMQKNAAYLVTLTTSSEATLRVMAANQPTKSSDGGVKFFEASFEMDAVLPEDFVVFADFVDKSSSHAVRVEVRSGEKALVDTTLWGTGGIEDVVEVRLP